MKKPPQSSEKASSSYEKALTSSEKVRVCSCAARLAGHTAWKKTGIFVKLNGAGPPAGQNFQILDKCSGKVGQGRVDRDDRWYS